MIQTSWRSESSNVSLVVLDKLIFVKKKLIIDGTVKVESLLITDNMSSKVVSFFKESSRWKRLHIDGPVNVDIDIRDNCVHLLHWEKTPSYFCCRGPELPVRPTGRSCSNWQAGCQKYFITNRNMIVIFKVNLSKSLNFRFFIMCVCVCVYVVCM